jgi:hypothetical protein
MLRVRTVMFARSLNEITWLRGVGRRMRCSLLAATGAPVRGMMGIITFRGTQNGSSGLRGRNTRAKC